MLAEAIHHSHTQGEREVGKLTVAGRVCLPGLKTFTASVVRPPESTHWPRHSLLITGWQSKDKVQYFIYFSVKQWSESFVVKNQFASQL